MVEVVVLPVVGFVAFAAAFEMMMGDTEFEFEFELSIFPPMTPRPKSRAKVMAARARIAAMAQHPGWQQLLFWAGSS